MLLWQVLRGFTEYHVQLRSGAGRSHQKRTVFWESKNCQNSSKK